MRIMPAGSEAAVESLRRRPAPKSGFADLVNADETEPDQTGATESIGSVAAASLLAAPLPPDPDARDGQARRKGNALLRALSGLQAALLGTSAAEARQQLAGTASVPAEADDPALEDALRAIAVRVAVELAKAA